jgi:glycosyltransferase involved in cell wall biosynthesis
MPRSGSHVKYSALIPAFDAAATIAAAIGSMLRQTVPPDEIIVVDDGSTDATGEIARACDPRVRVIRQPNLGPGAATNLAMQKTTLPIIASLDADDIWLPGKMEAQLRHLVANPEASAVFTHLRTFREDGLRAGVDVVSPGWSRTTMVIRREAAIAIGDLVDPSGGGRGEMVDWLARARHLGLQLDMLDEVHALRRIRPGSLSYGRDAERDKGYARAAWLALRRRKGMA